MRLIVLAAVSVGLLAAACSKPSEPSNPAVNADQNREAAAAAPGDNSFTEDQARGHLVNAGYSDVGVLIQDAEGKWTGLAMKDGKSMEVAVDYQGTITPAGAATAPAQ